MASERSNLSDQNLKNQCLHLKILALVLCGLLSTGANAVDLGSARLKHVLLISVDGLHALDVQIFVENHPQSNLAWLTKHGLEYTQAHTVSPADSFPGLLALITGGSPAVTGVYYDVTYDRRLSPPGSDCHQIGTAVVYDESLDKVDAKMGDLGLDTALLPRDPVGCKPVYPHSYLRVNTLFEVIRDAGGYTAWVDKHPVYEIINGPSGRGANDLYTPEIGANFNGNEDGNTDKITASIVSTERYDSRKIDAIINEINGFQHDGKTRAPVPALFGLNLQTISVAQKRAGYADAQGQPTPPLAQALLDVDVLLGKIIRALQQQKLLDSTLIVVTAKHGNGPINPDELQHVDEKSLSAVIERAVPGGIATIISDHGALIWLHDQTKTAVVAQALMRDHVALGMSTVLYDASLSLYFPSPHQDVRTPDIIVIPQPGVIYAQAGDDKKAEHGGFLEDDTHVALVLFNPFLSHPGEVIRTPVSTTQVAPTILEGLGIPATRLQAVAKEGVVSLPGEQWAH